LPRHYCTNSGNLSSLLVENNIYIGVNNPLQEDADGDMLNRGNVFTNTTGSRTSGGTGFAPPYTLTADPTANLEATIRAQAGRTNRAARVPGASRPGVRPSRARSSCHWRAR
jgi:pectinesterase